MLMLGNYLIAIIRLKTTKGVSKKKAIHIFLLIELMAPMEKLDYRMKKP